MNVVSLFSEDVASMLRNRVQHQAVRTMGASLSDTYMQVGTTAAPHKSPIAAILAEMHANSMDMT